ncbi:MAG: hypothetical protein JOZ14_01345, partial [Acidobacteria bacterium]|nr:hypothetical protein [Acidobacteriota bacterium]
MRVEGGGRPAVTISRRGADRVRAGHPWVYRSDVVEARNVYPGALVTVAQERKGRREEVATASRRPPASILGCAFYSTASEIAIRMVSARAIEDPAPLIRERIREAI